MRVIRNYKTPLERQVGEAVAIKEAQEKGYTLMNSKSESNRCIIPRITMDTENETSKRLREEEEVERENKKKVKLLRKRKAERKDEDLRELCSRMLRENNMRWEKRKKEEVKKKEEDEKRERELWERTKRLNLAKSKREKLLKKLEMKKGIAPRMDSKLIEIKKEMWMKVRESTVIDEEEAEQIEKVNRKNSCKTTES